jgi:hypothetical protein
VKRSTLSAVLDGLITVVAALGLMPFLCKLFIPESRGLAVELPRACPYCRVFRKGFQAVFFLAFLFSVVAVIKFAWRVC